NTEEFQKLSGAAQNLLELLYGNKTSVASSSSSLFSAATASRLFETPFAFDSAPSVFNALLDELADNVLVNAVPDANAQDTQSETTLVLGSGQTIVVGFNDSGSFGLPAPVNHFTGYSSSTNNGISFTDLGRLPNSTNGDAGDPVLARHDATGAIFFSTL